MTTGPDATKTFVVTSQPVQLVPSIPQLQHVVASHVSSGTSLGTNEKSEEESLALVQGTVGLTTDAVAVGPAPIQVSTDLVQTEPSGISPATVISTSQLSPVIPSGVTIGSSGAPVNETKMFQF